MKKNLLTLMVFCLVFRMMSCAPSKTTNDAMTYKELHNTSWILFNKKDMTRADTMTFSFGYYNTGGQLNLIDYNSAGQKEQLEFKMKNNTIRFNSYSIAPPIANTTFNSCRGESVLYYSNKNLYFLSFTGYCDNDRKQLMSDSSVLMMRRL